MIQISNIKIRKDISDTKLFETIIKKYKIEPKDVVEWHISRKSIDARKKDDIHYIYSIDLKLKNENKYKKFNKVKEFNIPKKKAINTDKKNEVNFGAWPIGLYSALTLLHNGISPIVFEQGESVENRKISVDKFLKNGNLNVLSNVQFGEGGAGTFSDGKLTTGINSPYCKKVLQEFVNFGAPVQI